jgi:predicted DNA-binding transcriptional regulator AlpA
VTDEKFIDLKGLCLALCISQSKYYAMINTKSEIHDPDLPKVINPFNDNKLRFYSEHVEDYIVKRLRYAS